MLDVRPTAYVVPVAEQDFQSLTPLITIVNSGTVPALVTGHVHIYRESTGLRIYTSELRITTILAGASADVATLSPWSPPAPADNDYFIMCDITATATVPHEPPGIVTQLGPYTFDIKPVGMGPAPAAHHGTHELGGSDELDVTGLKGAALKGSQSIPSSTTPSPDAEHYSQYSLTALADDADFAAPLGTPVDGQKLILRIRDDTTPRALTWDAIYANRGATLPATTVSGKVHYIGLIYNDDLSTWDCVAATVEA